MHLHKYFYCNWMETQVNPYSIVPDFTEFGQGYQEGIFGNFCGESSFHKVQHKVTE